MQTLNVIVPACPIFSSCCWSRHSARPSLTALNIPNRCWVLIHESPPTDRPDERVLDFC